MTRTLDENRVAECISDIRRAYDAETIVRHIVSQASQVTDAAFHPVGFERCRGGSVGAFNDPGYCWTLFASQLGRSVAFKEQQYVYRSLTEQVPVADAIISGANPDFDILLEQVEELERTGQRPNVLLVPIQLMIEPFYDRFAPQLEWSAESEILRLSPKTALRVLWNGAAFLDRIVILSTSGTVWHVKPDSKTGHSLSVDIAESELHVGEVEWTVRTAVKFEITDPQAFRAVLVQGEAS